jgi:uncharacterized protein (TIGR03435 family)
MFRAATAALVFCAAALAQTPASPTFEVASIKPAAPQEMGRMMVGMRGGPGTPDPTQVTFTNMSLTNLVTVAYGIRDYQVTAPSWMDTTRFDVVAKIPAGATKDDFKLMMQNLLAERFKLVVHKDSKEVPIYALLVGKNGPKLKESPKEAPPADDAPAPGRGGNIAIGPPQRDKNGFPVLRGGRGNMIMMGPNGRLQMVGGHMTMSTLAANLSGQLGRPVIDMTGLTGEYDYQMEFTSEGLTAPRGMPKPPPGAGPGPGEGGRGAAEASEPGPSIFTAVQDQLGLKLESRKGPMELVVVDSCEKTPTEN